jgi:hypothetical protein
MVDNDNSGDFTQENEDNLSSSLEAPSDGGKGRNWKTALFVALVLVAGAVAGHSLLRNDRSYDKGVSCGGDAPCAACPLGKNIVAGKPSENAPASAGDQTGVQSMPCCAQQACPLNDTACCPGGVCPAGSVPSTADEAEPLPSGCPYAGGGCCGSRAETQDSVE